MGLISVWHTGCRRSVTLRGVTLVKAPPLTQITGHLPPPTHTQTSHTCCLEECDHVSRLPCRLLHVLQRGRRYSQAELARIIQAPAAVGIRTQGAGSRGAQGRTQSQQHRRVVCRPRPRGGGRGREEGRGEGRGGGGEIDTWLQMMQMTMKQMQTMKMTTTRRG